LFAVDLASSLTVENLQAMLADPATVRELQRHLPALGDSGAATETEQLRSTLQSPQFQQVSFSNHNNEAAVFTLYFAIRFGN